MSQDAAIHAAHNAATVNAIESAPVSVGLAIAAVVGVCAIVSAVWAVAAIRANDKEAQSKETREGDESTMNAVNRVEKKADINHEQLHARVNSLVITDGEMREKYGYLKGVQETQQVFLLKVIDMINNNNKG